MHAVDAERRLPMLSPSTPSVLTRDDTEETIAETYLRSAKLSFLSYCNCWLRRIVSEDLEIAQETFTSESKVMRNDCRVGPIWLFLRICRTDLQICLHFFHYR